jgi:hypothetical protein
MGEDQVMLDPDGNAMLPSDDTLVKPELKYGYWSKWTGSEWVLEKKPTTIQEIINGNYTVISNSPDSFDREMVDIINSLVPYNDENYRVVTDPDTFVMHIELIPEEEKQLKADQAVQNELEAKLNDIKTQLSTATLMGDEEWIAELKAEYQSLING